MEKHQKSAEEHKKTGASNLEYNLVAEMHSLLKGNAVLEQYIEDARTVGDKEVESCFKTLQDQNKEHVTKVRELLGQRLGQGKARAA